MSGGSLNYFYSELESHVDDLGDRELNDLVKDLVTLFHDREWFLSSDTCEGSWVESRDAFKKKWFGDGSRPERIKKYLDDIRNEVLAEFGVSDRYCKNCKRWTEEKGDDSPYGNCDITSGCLMHRSETCDKFLKRGERITAMDVPGLWCDDITFCPEKCRMTSCPRNSKNIRDKSVPHSYSVGIPDDCPKKG